MQKRKKSARHVKAANARWRAVPEAESPPMPEDNREPFYLLFKRYGGADLKVEPRRGYVAWRAIDKDTGAVVHVAALKEMLHKIADELPRMLAARNFL